MPDENMEFSLSEFSPASYDDWLHEAEKVLSGRSPESTLNLSNKNQLRIKPIYIKDDVRQIKIQGLPREIDLTFGRNKELKANPVAWGIAQALAYPTPDLFNAAAHADLKLGQTAITLKPDKTAGLGFDPDKAKADQVGAEGISISSLTDMATALSGIDIERTPIYIDTGTSALALAAIFIVYARDQGADLNRLRGAISFDPLGQLVSTGSLPGSLDNIYDEMSALTAWANQIRCPLFTITADAGSYADAGASAVEELAFAIATGTEYLREMTNRGLAIADVSSYMRFIFSVDSNFFAEIAKLRAFRQLWLIILEYCNVKPESQKVFLHCRTSIHNVTAYDPYSNILRATTEALSAIIGGCDSLHVGYFDQAVGLPDDFSGRLARNIQLILRDESYLAKVTDAAAGSWYLESLTDQIADKAWSLFQDIEKKGGMYKALGDGFPQELVEQAARNRIADLTRQKEILIGTNLYPDPHEKKLARKIIDPSEISAERKRQLQSQRAGRNENAVARSLRELSISRGYLTPGSVDQAIEAAARGATIGEILNACRKNDKAAPRIRRIKAVRLAEKFEVIRKAVEDYRVKFKSNIKACVVKLEAAPDTKTKIDFAAGLLQIAGIEVISDSPDEPPEKIIETAIEKSAKIVAIATDIKSNADSAIEKIRQLRTSWPDVIFVLADNPGESAQVWRQAGVDEFAYSGIDLGGTLIRILKMLGINL